jgi:GxxExxY protein
LELALQVEGYSEAIYRNALEREAMLRGYSVEREVIVNVLYKGHQVGFVKADLILTPPNGGPRIVLELKAVATAQTDDNTYQLKKYLTHTGHTEGFLINFAQGKGCLAIKRITNL